MSEKRRLAMDIDKVPVAPSLGPAFSTLNITSKKSPLDARVMLISAISIVLGIASGLVAKLMTSLIGLITNVAFYGRFSFAMVTPADNRLGIFVFLVPLAGAIIIGLMARYGSKGVMGDGIPEAMEKVLVNESRIPARLTFLKPLSAAISIGTGGPFGAEGPVIATGGALGSLVGQLLHTTSHERKTLLAAGASAGIAAIFGTPITAVVLAIELLLFEFRPRSFVPVALACSAAAGMRYIIEGTTPIFAMPGLAPASVPALAVYLGIGALIGIVAAFVTRLIYWIEDFFEHLPVHWMWWPAIGSIFVGIIGYYAPHTLGVGYDNIQRITSGSLLGSALVSISLWKLASWAISLGSGTSGGTLAPLFTIGGGIGALLGWGATYLFPHAGIDPRMAALVGMASIFAGASKALLTSVLFAFESTGVYNGLLPLLAGCTAAYVVASFLIETSIMSEKIVRRGIAVPIEFGADALESLTVKDHASRNVTSFRSTEVVSLVKPLLQSGKPEYAHQVFPVLDNQGAVKGLVHRYEVINPATDPNMPVGQLALVPMVSLPESASLREAANLMVQHDVGRLIVVNDEGGMVGIISRSDLLTAQKRRLRSLHARERSLRLRSPRVEGKATKASTLAK